MNTEAITANFAHWLRESAEPLSVALSSEATFNAFLRELGWSASVTAADMPAIRARLDVNGLLRSLATLGTSLRAGTGSEAQKIADLLAVLVQIADRIRAWTPSGTASLPAPLNQTAFWNEFPGDLLDRLVFQGLDRHVPMLTSALWSVQVLDRRTVTPAGASRVQYVRYNIQWDRLGQMLTDPVGLAKESFSWNGPQPFDHERMLGILAHAMQRSNLPARLEVPEASLRDRYYSAGNPSLPVVRVLKIPLIKEHLSGGSDFAELGLFIFPIPPAGSPGAAPVGFALGPLVRGMVSATVPADIPHVQVQVRGALTTGTDFLAEVRPSGVGLVLPAGGGSISAEVVVSNKRPEPYVLMGSPGTHRVELEGFRAMLGVRGSLADPEVLMEVGTGEGTPPPRLRFILQAGESDSFLRALLGDGPVSLDLSGKVTWSSRHGLGINGTAGFDIYLPLHRQLGPVELQALRIAASGGTGGAAVGLGLAFRAALGPVQAAVEDVGARLKLTPSTGGQPSGVFGNLDWDWEFQPPRGVGLSIDTGVVKGGGYLSFDPDRGEYAGAMELAFANLLTLKAIGLVTTRQPDGSGGFSLLVIITAEFGQGIQLGFGFTLLAVGGLLGLHRTMRLDLLAQGARSGALSTILFPRDVVANAQRILSDLRTFFPQRQGTFLIGPMAKLGWGTPTLVTITLGIIIEIPGNVAIVGVLRVALPDERAAVLVLQVSFIGAIEFDKKRVWLFASLFDSRVLFITIEGEMGVLVAWGDQPNFVVSVGGFHPRFSPPPLPFPTPRRVAVSLINTSAAKVRIEGYFAVTSNTAQFGARAELFFGMRALNVSGHIGFDALFQFSPFHFIIDISASFSARVFGAGLFSVSVQMSLEGPTPWRARGTGSIKLLFVRVSANFDVTWGESRNTTLPPIAVVPLLRAELEKGENWRAQLPQGNRELVSLRTLPASEAGLVLHPVGTLRVSQRALPLELTVDRVGSQRPSDARRLSLSVATGGLAKVGDVMEQFAPAQFQDMSNDQKLSRPAFGAQKGGLDLSVTGRQIASSRAVKRTVRYEMSVTDTNYRRKPVRFAAFGGRLFHFFARGGAISQSELSTLRRDRLQPFAERVAVGDDGFTVAFQHDNRAVAAEAASFASEASAREYLSQRVAADPNLADALHVIPVFERAA